MQVGGLTFPFVNPSSARSPTSTTAAAISPAPSPSTPSPSAAAEVTVLFLSVGILSGMLWAKPALGHLVDVGRAPHHLPSPLAAVRQLSPRLSPLLFHRPGLHPLRRPSPSSWPRSMSPSVYMSTRWYRTQHPSPVSSRWTPGSGLDHSMYPAPSSPTSSPGSSGDSSSSPCATPLSRRRQRAHHAAVQQAIAKPGGAMIHLDMSSMADRHPRHRLPRRHPGRAEVALRRPGPPGTCAAKRGRPNPMKVCSKPLLFKNLARKNPARKKSNEAANCGRLRCPRRAATFLSARRSMPRRATIGGTRR